MGSSALLYKTPEWLEAVWVNDDVEADDGTAPEVAAEPEIPRPEERTLPQFVEDLARERANYEADAKVLSLRIKELQEKKRRADERSEFLKKRILQEMLIQSVQKVKTPEFTVYWYEREAGIEVVDPTLLPEAFVRVVAEPNKKAINEHYKTTGQMIPGCDEGEPSKVIVIK